MSDKNLPRASVNCPGFYGKLPVLGDFVSRRLSQDFLVNWDSWLQSAITCSKEQLGGQWLDYYLTGPVWQFILSPGVCGGQAWAGVVMSSVDRVGRYFPLTIARAIEDLPSLSLMTPETESWFSKIEGIALAALDEDLSINEIDELLIQVNSDCWCHRNFIAVEDNNETGKASGKKAFLLQSQQPEATLSENLQGLNNHLINSCFLNYSLWTTGGSENVNRSLLMCEGLPPVNAYSGLLSGQIPSRGWSLQKKLINSLIELQIDRQQAAKPDENLIPNMNGLVDFARLRWCSKSAIHCGKCRHTNEDALLDRPDKGIWVIADGMGGYQAGDVASTMIVEAVDQLQPSDILPNSIDRVKECLYQVNGQLRQLTATRYENQTVGSTVVAFVADGSRFACVWAGDSRLYRLRDSRLQQMTIDHCEDTAQLADLSGSGMQSLKVNNVITRAVGALDELELDCEYIDCQVGDKFLLTSDGVDKELSPFEIERILNEDNHNDADALMQAVLAKEARDNVSLIVIEINRSYSF